MPAEAASIYECLQGQRIGASHPKWEVAEVKLTNPARSEQGEREALFLASDEASYITGAELLVDGDLTL